VSVPARLDTEARTLLALAPDWRRPLTWLGVLSAYVAGAPARGDTCLCLDARDPGLPRALVRELVVRACDGLAEGGEFAEILLVEDPVELEALAEPVTSAEELLDRLGLPLGRLDEAPAALLAHARWAKRLADELQAMLDADALARAGRPWLGGEPLVTVRIATYGSAQLLVERALPSVLQGPYRNVEVLVCSDGPQPHARAAVEGVQDPRVRYLELAERPAYPSRREAFWQTAGTFAVNRMLDEARGELIAPLDHDDAFTDQHLPLLVEAARQGADLVYGQGLMELPDGPWTIVGSAPLAHAQVLHGAVAYTRRLAHMRYDPHAWVLDEPGDWNLWRRVTGTGATIAHVPAPVVVHFRERTAAPEPSAAHRRLEETAHDLLETSARALLEVASPVTGRLGGGARRRSARVRPRRLAVVDGPFPLPASGFRCAEAAELLALRPDTAFFSAAPTGEPWPAPVHPLHAFAELAPQLGITDVYAVFLNHVAGLLGLECEAGAAGCGGVRPGTSIAEALARHGIALHATLYPGGGLTTLTDPALVRRVAERCATVFSNADEALAASPRVRRMPGPIATDHYAFRKRGMARPLEVVFAAADNPRKGLDTVLAAVARLGDAVHLHVVGPPPERVAGLERVSHHGWLAPDALRELYWRCHVVASPTRIEREDRRPGEVGLLDGFPTTTSCDAVAAGCALVASSPRGDRSVLLPGEHYLEVPPEDPEALAQALRALAADPARRERLAWAGAARVREGHDVGVVARAKLAAMGLGR
jgi:glycosyltransferase involved in cell wall biosynthesis